MLDLIKLAVLPPFFNVILMSGGLLLLRWRPRIGKVALVFGIVSLYLLSIPSALSVLSIGLEDHDIPTTEEASRAGAIVVLGGGREVNAPHWDGRDVVAEAPLARLAEAARWHRRTGLPILLTGGRGGNEEAESEAELMARMLEEAFGIQARWLENESGTTRENADFSAPILKEAGIDTILLVTHAAHLTRAAPEFRHNGLNVIPAPMGFTHATDEGEISLMPRAYYLTRSSRLLHERIGIVYYGLTR